MEAFSPSTLQQSFVFALNNTLAQIMSFFPQLVGALLILLIGALIAKWIRTLVVKLLETLKLSKMVSNTPVEAFLKQADLTKKIESLLGGLVYWLVMLLVFQTAVSMLGLNSLSMVFDKLLGYMPKIFSAILLLVFGVLVAGFLESLVKGSIRSIEGAHARMIAKVTSYVTLAVFILAAISELGIAQEFILILFIGVVATLSLGMGLSLGLGSKDLVKNLVESWYKEKLGLPKKK